MKPTNNWNTTEAKTNNAAQPKLPAGGYGCKILKLEEGVNSQGKPIVLLYADICDGSTYDGYFTKQFKSKKEWTEKNNKPTPKYGCIFRCRKTDDKNDTNPRFKGLITTVEESNTNYVWNWDESTLKGKKIGIVFREEEYDVNGYHGWSVKPFYVCKYDDAAAQAIPEKKPLTTNPVTNAVADMTPTEDDDLPF